MWHEGQQKAEVSAPAQRFTRPHQATGRGWDAHPRECAVFAFGLQSEQRGERRRAVTPRFVASLGGGRLSISGPLKTGP